MEQDLYITLYYCNVISISYTPVRGEYLSYDPSSGKAEDAGDN